MKQIKGWALKNKRGHLIWKVNQAFYDPIKTAIFRKRGQAVQYLKNINAPWNEAKAVQIIIEIREIEK